MVRKEVTSLLFYKVGNNRGLGSAGKGRFVDEPISSGEISSIPVSKKKKKRRPRSTERVKIKLTFPLSSRFRVIRIKTSSYINLVPFENGPVRRLNIDKSHKFDIMMLKQQLRRLDVLRLYQQDRQVKMPKYQKM